MFKKIIIACMLSGISLQAVPDLRTTGKTGAAAGAAGVLAVSSLIVYKEYRLYAINRILGDPARSWNLYDNKRESPRSLVVG